MKKLMPVLILIGMCLLLVVSWKNVSAARNESALQYDKTVKEAERMEEKEIYGGDSGAIKKYQSALRQKPGDYEMAMHIVSLYDKMEEADEPYDTNDYVAACQAAIKCDPKQADPYCIAVDKLISQKQEKDAYQIILKAKKNMEDENGDPLEGVDADKLKQLEEQRIEMLSTYSQFNFEFDGFYGFHQIGGTESDRAKVSLDGKFGLITGTGSTAADCLYDDINLAGNDLIAIEKDGEYFFIAGAGGRRVVTDSQADWLGVFSNKYAPVKYGDAYGYIDKKMKEYHFEYEYAGNFENGIAPVKKDGKWGVIKSDFSAVNGYDFDEILIDEYGFCAPYKVFFAKSGGSWALYSTGGEKLAEGFEDVRQFASKQPAAVKKDGKWGFISLKGEMVIEPEYTDAKSFSCGYAPVQQDGKWGCIGLDRKMLIQPEFLAMESFSSQGYAYAEIEPQPDEDSEDKKAELKNTPVMIRVTLYEKGE
ncbi:MAG: WG repeat-containing protein [Oscillospiraceae bacterium]|nr:WG repeat-containing protein [Oscillospiraceae bacterium]